MPVLLVPLKEKTWMVSTNGLCLSRLFVWRIAFGCFGLYSYTLFVVLSINHMIWDALCRFLARNARSIFKP